MAKIINKPPASTKPIVQAQRPLLAEGSYWAKSVDLDPSEEDMKGKQSLNYKNSDRPTPIILEFDCGEFVFFVSEGLLKSCVEKQAFNYWLNI